MPIAGKYDESFKHELSKLNLAQQKAVGQIEGPVLVIAGPGTGKTQILSARIGNILSTTDTQAHNILCLTYTDAGTVAMRQRLLKFIGPDAYRVNIFTFHAFCNQVIQENLDYFGIRGLQPVSELEQVNILQKLIDKFSPEHPLRRNTGDIYFESGRLKNLFEVMKKEGWSPEFIAQKADEYLNDLPNREEFIYKKATKTAKAGDLKQHKIEEAKEKMEKLKAAAGEFRNYENAMQQARRYDYSDMILWVLDVFRNDKKFLIQYQERYHYFLVDEFQDTNGAQNEILQLITNYWERPNVFVVGDDDQSIYRFQGANVRNITDFNYRYKEDLNIVVLTENYRSSQKILDAAKALIENNQERLVNHLDNLSKDLVAKGEFASLDQQPTITEFHNTLHEELGIVKEIVKLKESGEDLSEVAVIYRNHRNVENIVKLLESREVPLNIKQKTNILELPFVKNLVNILAYIQEEFDEPDEAEFRLFELMHYDFFNISARDAAIIARHCYRERDEKKKEKVRWREVIASKEQMLKLGLESARHISTLEENLTYWIKELPNMTVQGLFEKILTRGGVIGWVMNQPDKVWLVQVITTFFDFIKEESARTQDYQLTELLDTLDKMRRNNIPIFLNKIIHAEKGVNFITAHSSKGLEFKHVFLISCLSDVWENKRNRPSTYAFPDTVTESNEENQKEEERRLFYVAITRAKQYLHLSYATRSSGGKEQEMSQFVAEILDKLPIEIQKVHLPDPEISVAQMELMISAEPPKIELIDKEYVKKHLEHYRMSVTHLNKFLRCPLAFYFENVLRVPTARSESMGFGSAVHYALETLFTKMLQSEQKEFPTRQDFIGFFAWGMRMYHSHFTPKEFKRRLEYGTMILEPLYDQYVSQWNRKVQIEYDIHMAEMDGVPLNGKIDKIEIEEGNKINVVDYKTGKPENGTKKIFVPNEKDPEGGDYWRQIVFYKILLDNEPRKKYEMLSGELDFVEPSKNKEYIKRRIVVTPDHISLVKQQIKDTYLSIKNLEFTTGCGKEDCQWCNFVKYNYKSDMLDLQEPADE